MNKLRHLQTKTVGESGVFAGLSSYDGMIGAIVKHGMKLGKRGSDEYNDFVGAAYEVFTEFFFARYGTEANPHLGVKHITDTSRNKFQAGYDFTYENFEGLPCLLQVKFRSNPADRFDMSSFGTFCFQGMALGITAREQLIWFTNLSNKGDDGIFKQSISAQGQKMMRVIGRDEQESFIDRDPSFWRELNMVVNLSTVAPTDFVDPPELWDHQVTMNGAVQPIIENGGNGRVICATGGGKTRVIYQNIMDGFKRGFSLQIVVAPTIDLLRQHHEYFQRYGAFHVHGVSVAHFRTGDESTDKWDDYFQKTSALDLISWMQNRTRVLVFVTYASETKLLDGLSSKDIEANLICWDEFHHTVQQTTEQRDHLLSLPSARNLFYSASIKRGRLVSAMDEDLYGPLLCEIKYSDLRKTGILVPKIIIKTLILRDGAKIKGLEVAMKKAAKKENFDLRTGVIEAAGTIAAHADMMKTGFCNAVTFSKSVAICKEMATNLAIRNQFSGFLNTVHASVPSRDRKKIYEAIAASSDSVLCQFSVVKEGIDINPFNCVIFSRNTDVIGTQQAIGRAVRANPQDTKNLKAGLISIDNPEGWVKYSATVFVIVHDAEIATFKDFLVDLVLKLQFAGLEEDDYAFADVDEGLHGVDGDDDGWVVPMTSLKNVIGAESIQSAVKNVQIELIHTAEMEAELEHAKTVTMEDLL